MRVYHDILSSVPTDYEAPEVVVEGLTITVPAGTRGSDGTLLEEDFSHTLSGPPGVNTVVALWLVRRVRSV